MKMQPKNETGIPAPEKRSAPPGPEAGKGEVKRATVVRLYNTNTSPLWKVPIAKMLNLAEEYCEDEYFAVLGGLCGAKLIVIMHQVDDESGLIAVDEEGMPVEIPEIPLSWFAEKWEEEIEEWVNGFSPEVLAKMVFQHHQKTQQQ
ncbi:MAG: hypothetical protein MRT15_10080 [archaeon YNP-LCB-003-016]|nr:hypothetical protein [Candidatus Culexarchaeum yellowstonense]